MSDSFNDSSGSMSSRQTLSMLSNAADAEPLIMPYDTTFLDEFVIDDDDPFWDMIQEEELEVNGLDALGGTDFLDIMDAFMRDESQFRLDDKRPVTYTKYNFYDIPKGVRPITEHEATQYCGDNITMYTDLQSTEVYLKGSLGSVCVGRSKPDINFTMPIVSKDYFRVANTYSEEVGGKGVNLGYSSFYHSVTILALASNSDGVIEPHEGYDYAYGGITFEITGEQWRSRDSDADVILSKYMVNSGIMSSLPYQDDYTRWSHNEDDGLLSSFYGTAFDYETTTRSGIIKEISQLLPKITNAQRAALGKNYLALCSERPVVAKDTAGPNRNFTDTITKIQNCIRIGSKERDDVYYVPSPFRILYPQDEDDDLLEDTARIRQSVMVYTTDYGPSTYHTWIADEDPTDVVRSQNEKYPEKDHYTHNSIHDILHQGYKKYKSYTSATIQAALLPKIHGKGGCFYDVYNRVGISWWRRNSSSLSWDAVYYLFSPPGDIKEVGKWSYNSVKNIYISPTFKVSRQDIHYAQILPAKIDALVSAMRPLLTPQEFNTNLPIVMGLITLQSNSTWATSYRTGANRFVTCCHMSESGDIPSLLEGQLTHLKYLRFPDYYILKLMLKYIKDRPPSSITPFFRLPMALMSYEKDFSQTLQWHMRATDHSTNCMIKVTEAAKRHAGEEDATNEWMSLQLDFFRKMITLGASKQDYKNIMLSAPDHPCLNIIMFIGMCSLVRDDIQSIGSVQHAMGFSIWNMITDRHCTEFKGYTSNGTPQLKTSRVLEAMSNYIRSLGGVTGAYELVAKMARGNKLPPNYLLNHYKDAKEAEREISQMHPEHRIKQNLPEVLVETFTGNNEADQMSDPSKYNKHVEDTMDRNIKGIAMHASEDRSKFCQEQEVQQQALGIACISYEAGSTAMRTAAAMTLMNKTRVIVYPEDADHKKLIGDFPSGTAIIVSGKKTSVTKTIRIEKNMTQGLGAVTAGALNTIYVTATNLVASKLIEGLDIKTVKTTSDDVKRTASYSGTMDFDHVAENFFIMPNRDLNQVMMVNNTKKFIKSYFFSEFNNVVATISGMIPQSPIFATLAIQPLLSKSLFGDIVSVVNISRSTMSWGCPPDTMEASLHSLIRVLRQKWLLSDDEIDMIWNCGFFPAKISHHISGFWIRNDLMIKRIFAQFTEEQRQDVLSGDVALYDMLKRAELDLDKRKKKRKMPYTDIVGLHRANRVAKTIVAQRYTAEKLMSRHVAPIHPKVRDAAKRKFFKILNTETPDIDVTDLQKLRPPEITVHTRIARKQDRAPTSVGTSTVLDGLSLQRIRAKKFTNVNYRNHCSEAELEIARLPPDEYDKRIAVIERAKHYEGLSYKSPVGLPLTRIFDNVIFSRPASFNFSVDLSAIHRENQPFTHRGVQVNNFKPMIYGTATLGRISKNKKTRLAFGHGLMHGKHMIFYRDNKRSSEVQCIPIYNKPNTLASTNYRGLIVYYLLPLDATPLLYVHHQSDAKPYTAGIIGDNEAVLNYGFYCRSNQVHGFAVYQKLFTNYNSCIPSFVIKHMPQYPFFPYRDNSITIERGNITALRNYNCISYLRLCSAEEPKDVVTINLSGERPVEVVETLDAIFIEDW